MKHTFCKGDLLLVIDPQKDFMPGGALNIEKSDQAIPTINKWIDIAVRTKTPIVISRHWHPIDHISFKENGGVWERYCVQNTPGAMFHSDLTVPSEAIIINKAFLQDKEEYSAFEGVTADNMIPLVDIVKERGIKRVWIVGFTLEHCVYHSAVGAALLGLKAHIISQGCRGISTNICGKATEHLKKLGVVFEDALSP